MVIAALTPEAIIALLSMKPHPEGGHYVELYVDDLQYTAGKPQ